MLTERDVWLVRQLERTGGMTARQIAVAASLTIAAPAPREPAQIAAQAADARARKKRPSSTSTSSTGERIAARRMAELHRLGFVRAARPYGPGSEGIWVPTRLGMRELLGDDATDDDPSIGAGTYKHQYGCGEVYALLTRANVYHLTEREIRRTHNAEGQRKWSLATGPDSWHQPDGLIYPTAEHAREDKPIAIELERSRKGGTRLRKLMERYRSHEVVDHVVYVCTRETLISTRNVVAGRPARKGVAPKTPLDDTVTVMALGDLYTELPALLRARGAIAAPEFTEPETRRFAVAVARYF